MGVTVGCQSITLAITYSQFISGASLELQTLWSYYLYISTFSHKPFFETTFACLSWTEAAAFNVFMLCLTPVIIFADNKSHQDLCTTDYQGELFKDWITILMERW